ncbi:MAG: hypothetical protein ACOYK6_03300 [Chthoniobacterales bacterium]
MPPSELASLTTDIANTLYQNLNPNKDSKGQLFISNPETSQPNDPIPDNYLEPEQPTPSGGSGGGGGGTQSTGLSSSSSGDQLTFADIAEMLAQFGVSLSSDLQAQTTALIDAVNATAAAGVAAGQDTINAGGQLLQQATASFYTSVAFTLATGAVSLGASKAGNDAADNEAEQQTDFATEQAEQTTLKTEEAVKAEGSEAPRTRFEAESALSKSEAANKPLNTRSSVAQQNEETNQLCKKALEAKQKALTATDNAEKERFNDEANNHLAQAKASQTKAHDLIYSKRALASSKEAVAATRKYHEKPTNENKLAAETANEKAKMDYEKLSNSSPIKMHLQAACENNDNIIKSHSTNPSDPAYDSIQNGDPDTNVVQAYNNQANAELAQPKNVYLASRFSQAGAQAAGQYMQMNMIFGSLGESASNAVGASFAAQAKTDEGNAQKQSAASQAIGQGVSSTNTNIQSMTSLIASFQSGSKAAIDAMSTVVSSVRGA